MKSRIANKGDQQSIAALLEELRNKPVSIEAFTEQFSAITDSDDKAVLLIEDEAGPQAMAVVNLLYKLPNIVCHIDEVVVAETARGKGYGKAIMAACEVWAWEHGAQTIELTSRPSREAANALYQKLGYELRETNVYKKLRPEE